MLTLATAHALCVACLLVDVAARAWRLQLLVGALGGRVGFLQALGANLAEDAGGALTPWRLGGTPVRTMMLSGARGGPRVPAPLTLLAGLAESGLQTPVVLVAGAALAAAFAPDWWHTVGPAFTRSALHAGRWLLLAAALGALAWMLTRGLVPHRHHSLRQRLLDPLRDLRRFPKRSLVPCAALTIVSVATRVAILPLLAVAAHPPAAPGPATLGSLALLFGQVLLPTPSGAGAVELGVLAGGAGVSGAAATSLLLAWRAYTTLVPVAAGLLAIAVRAIRRGTPGCVGDGAGTAPDVAASASRCDDAPASRSGR